MMTAVEAGVAVTTTTTMLITAAVQITAPRPQIITKHEQFKTTYYSLRRLIDSIASIFASMLFIVFRNATSIYNQASSDSILIGVLVSIDRVRLKVCQPIRIYQAE